MQFFTWKLWRQMNCGSDEAFALANEAWARNHQAYQAQLRPLLDRFNKRNRRFWNGDEHHLHDGGVVRLTLGDAVGADLAAGRPQLSHSSMIIEVIEWGGKLCILKYGQIEAIDARFRTCGWSWGGTIFETWGYDELTQEGADAFRHSILFSCGSEVSIVFKRFSYTRRRLPKSS
jgi:hypothetical protein